LKADIKRITDKFFAPGSDVTTFLDRFVRGLENLELTTGSVSGLPRVWLRNNDPRADTRPSLLFTDLPHPSPSDIRSRYPTSDTILQLIERCSTKMRDSGFMKTLEYWVLQSDKAQAHGNAWELMMMNVLAETFKTRALSDWPHEPSISSQCAALDGHAVIVGLDEQGLQRGISHEHISMEDFMEAHVNNDSVRHGRA
ncbi:hypothetical protein BGZ97_010116, partial [Linnemannia gamsii]